MKKINKFVLISLILFFSTNLFSQAFPPPPKDNQLPLAPGQSERPKKRFPLERKPEEPFMPVFFKTFQDENYVYLEVIFNSAIKKESIFEAFILINDKPVEKEFILFSRDGHRCKFRLYHSVEEFVNIKMEGIMSWDGLIISPVELINIEKNSMYKFDRETGQWQKFSL